MGVGKGDETLGTGFPVALGRSKSRSLDQLFIRSIMNTNDWAVHDAPDAFTLLQRAVVHARPDKASQHLHTANELWGLCPVGARLDLALTADADRVDHVRDGLTPIAFTEPVLVVEPEEDDEENAEADE